MLDFLEALYIVNGPQGIYDLADILGWKKWDYCRECDAETPTYTELDICAVCFWSR